MEKDGLAQIASLKEKSQKTQAEAAATEEEIKVQRMKLKELKRLIHQSHKDKPRSKSPASRSKSPPSRCKSLAKSGEERKQ